MPLPTGTWTIDLYGPAGGQGNLVVAVDNEGNLSGSTISGDQVIGFWNESQQTISFTRVQTLPTTFQIYTGYLFLVPTQTNEIHYTLAGNFEIYSPAGQGGTASANTYQWFAYQDVKTKEGKDGKDGSKDGKDHKDKDGKDNKDK